MLLFLNNETFELGFCFVWLWNDWIKVFFYNLNDDFDSVDMRLFYLLCRIFATK